MSRVRPDENLKDLDVIVVGGGINGCGVARDCALRGLRVVLVEKSDLASGASGANSGMIHGGARYLRSEMHVTRVSCLDSGTIQRIAPHLCFRIPFIAPVLEDTPNARALLELMEVFFEAYDVYQPLKNGKPSTRLTREEALELEPGLNPAIIGAVTFDEWGIDPFRLCVANMLSAVEHGAHVLTYHQVEALLRDGNQVVGVKARDLVTGQERRLRAPVVVNLCGAWAPRLAAMAGVKVRVRPGKGVHLVFDRRITNVAIVAAAVDKRQIFIEPHENGTILGTTDDDYYGDPDDLWATEDEIEYLLQAAETMFPSIRRYRMTRTFVGLRPTIYRYGTLEDDLSRDHAILDHEEDGAPGLITMIGGKLAAFRLMSEECTDRVCARLGRGGPCRTHLEPLPGGETGAAADEAPSTDPPRISPHTLGRLTYRHGRRAGAVLAGAGQTPSGDLDLVCRCEPVLEAEIRWVIRHEGARTLDDVRRRTRLAMGPCQGYRCIARAGAVLADELQLGPEAMLAQVMDLLQQRFRGKTPALSGPSLAQEELNQARYFLVGDLARCGGEADPTRTAEVNPRWEDNRISRIKTR